jgi:hypothetical protein
MDQLVWNCYLIVWRNWVFVDCVFGLDLLGQLVQICYHSYFLFVKFGSFCVGCLCYVIYCTDFKVNEFCLGVNGYVD